MPPIHKKTTYNPLKDVKNPFRVGQDKELADLLWDKFKEAQRWRLVGIGSLILNAFSLVLYRQSINLQQTVPVLVNVMPSGEAQYLGEVRQSGAMQVPEAAIQYQVRKFITNLRSVSTDRQVVFDNIDVCYAMITQSYDPIMTRMLRENSPFDLVGRIRRTVVIESVLNATTRTYHINWTETIIDTSSSQRSVRMRAVVTIRLIQPTSQTISKNPLGIYIENCEMTEL